MSPATVYAVNGGKQGLLRTLIDDWSTDAPIIAEKRAKMASLDDPIEVLRYLVEMTRQMREEFGDIMRLVLATAPHDATLRKALPSRPHGGVTSNPLLRNG